ncbi:Uncharacterized protein conserved in archaea [Archaeoglobus sulfaticallidus PM70-1]|uniref:Uncharacterized protein conserved in archaea n=1 Tax=Archaeoglobus sulfaticallidus PM70-1 TaxID=387631 RepID=N0BB86_9EURY|nr:YIP1 family protein [Archaeoglobus sulfaticallidus]AGK60869.1 Uncharacterized protein conserved in archaea [Archaeoglobus sulfaticallidus PM70-1]
MVNYIEPIYNPDNFFRKAKAEGIGFIVPVAIVVISAVIATINAYITADEIARITVEIINNKFAPDPGAMYQTIYISTIAGSFITPIIGWVILSGFAQGLSALFGGEGSFSQTLKFTAFSFYPGIILSPISIKIALDYELLLRTYGVQALLSKPFVQTQILIGIITILWQLFIWMFAIKHARNLSLKKSFIVAAMPLLIYIALIAMSSNRF